MTSAVDEVLVSKQGRVLSLILNRAEKKNALTSAMYQRLAEQICMAGEDAEIRAILISAHGDAFTAGNDLQDFESRAKSASAQPATSPAMQFIAALTAREKPVIAAVNGMAVGIGVTLLLHCDLVYAAQSARFRLPFVQLGLVPEAGSSQLLPRVVGARRASEMLLLGEWFDATSARADGLVNGVFDDEQLMAVASEKAEQLASLPAEAVSITRQLLSRPDEDLDDRIRYELQHFQRLLASDDADEARRAFREKRKPVFR